MGGLKVSAKRDRRKQATPVRRGGAQKKAPQMRGMVAVREIRKCRKSTNLLVPKLPFLRLVKQIAVYVASNNMQGFRFQAVAIQALHEAAVAHLAFKIEDTFLCPVQVHPSKLEGCGQ